MSWGMRTAITLFSGIPFSTIEKPARDRILNRIAGAMSDEGRFIAYQLTTRLCDEDHLFELAEKSFCALNFPPVNVMGFRRARADDHLRHAPGTEAGLSLAER